MLAFYTLYDTNKRITLDAKRARKLGILDDVKAKKTISEILGEQNQEVRSVILEKWNGKGLRKIDESKEGVLFSTASGERVVKVINSTKELDGTYKIYWLRVPPHITSAKDGVAWTFGLSKDDYNPKVET